MKICLKYQLIDYTCFCLVVFITLKKKGSLTKIVIVTKKLLNLEIFRYKICLTYNCFTQTITKIQTKDNNFKVELVAFCFNYFSKIFFKAKTTHSRSNLAAKKLKFTREAVKRKCFKSRILTKQTKLKQQWKRR